MKLSILIPVYNEKATIREVLKKVEETQFPVAKEILIIDDFSTDGTREILKSEFDGKYKVLYHDRNYGKGHALRTGIAAATGDYITIQDADLEYDPADLVPMLKRMMDENLSVLFGSREADANRNRPSGWIYWLGGHSVTIATNILYGQKLTDVMTCYKMYKARMLKGLPLRAERFEIEPELLALTARLGEKIKEHPISYKPRNVDEGKKINWKDAVWCFWVLLKYKFVQ